MLMNRSRTTDGYTAPDVGAGTGTASVPRTRATLWQLGLMIVLAIPLTSQAVTNNLPNFKNLVKDYGQAVVNVSVTPQDNSKASRLQQLPEGTPFPEFFEHFFEQYPNRRPRPESPLAQGSGFIISPDGYILTNTHVVDEAAQITVKLRDRREFPAELVGTDERSDVALIKIDGHDLPTVRIGDSDQVEVGEWVLAIGTPFGFENTATQGIVSALSRSLPNGTYVPFIQTDVAVNPGNSGGPLFDSEGNVVGINSQIYSRSGGYMGLSFAIPINVAMNVADQLKEHGYVSRGWLGVAIQDMNQPLAKSFGLKKPDGALVADVTPDSPAARAGIEVGDVILSFDSKPITRSGDLPPLVGATDDGTKVPMKILREGKMRILQVQVGKLDDADQPRLSKASSNADSPLGLAATNLDENQRNSLGVGERGVLVSEVDPDGPAAKAGLRSDDIILSFNRQEVKDASQLSELVSKAPTGEPVAVLILREQRTQYLPIVLPESVS
jgi:serine protease Do